MIIPCWLLRMVRPWTAKQSCSSYWGHWDTGKDTGIFSDCLHLIRPAVEEQRWDRTSQQAEALNVLKDEHNRTHSTATVVQDRAQGLRYWVLHTPYCSHASVIVDGANGLIKKCTDVSQPGWDTWLTQAVLIVNDCWGTYGSPRIETFCPERPPVDNVSIPNNGKDQPLLKAHMGQLVRVKLPSTSIVPVTLAKQAYTPGKLWMEVGKLIVFVSGG